MAIVTCLSTVYQNNSGVDGRFFGYLGPHGTKLDDGDTIEIPGPILAGSRNPARDMEKLSADLFSGDLLILSTPAAVAYDVTNERGQAFAAVNSSGSSIPACEYPCWVD